MSTGCATGFTPTPFGGGTMMGATATIKQGDTVFQRYTLRKVLGVGGMGVVWLAHDTKLDQEVALKFVPEALQHDADAINNLKAQIKLGLKLTHNNIVRVLGFEDDGDRLAAIAMEYVDGATLASMRVDQPAQIFEADSLHVYLLHSSMRS
ncbi:MAG TPA: protein kinase, partial [Prosthecobacter sp.]|nr:protein kinase [Prosthecobacter sp.]